MVIPVAKLMGKLFNGIQQNSLGDGHLLALCWSTSQMALLSPSSVPRATEPEFLLFI